MKQTADQEILRPGVIVGVHPDTGVIHRLTIGKNGAITIERQPYVSPLDGWTKTYDKLTCEASKHLYLILQIRQNPAQWPA